MHCVLAHSGSSNKRRDWRTAVVMTKCGGSSRVPRPAVLGSAKSEVVQKIDADMRLVCRGCGSTNELK